MAVGNQLWSVASSFRGNPFLFSRDHFLFVCLFFVFCNRGDSFMSQDGLQTRKLCQSPINVSATYDVKCSWIYYFTMDFVVTLGQTTTQPFLDPERTG